jgi:transposase
VVKVVLKVEDFEKIYLHKEFVDFRKSVNGLGIIVEEEMNLNLFEKLLFVFCNKTRKRIKILYWDRTGFALWYKRLEKDKFFWPQKLEDETITLTTQQLEWLLEGYNVWKLKPHNSLNFKSIS